MERQTPHRRLSLTGNRPSKRGTYTIEEAYEVEDAIARKDSEAICEELGDLLLQIVFHSRMAEEQGLFDFDTVAKKITNKMIERHPHVFGQKNKDPKPTIVKPGKIRNS